MMNDQCLKKDVKNKITEIINNYIICLNDKEECFRQLNKYTEQEIELAPEEAKEKAINIIRTMKKNVEDIPICK